VAEPTPDDVSGWPGVTVLEFGATGCPICQAARPRIDRALALAPDVRYVRVEDGPGRRLGRAFGVKLWPTLVVLRDGVEVARAVRPATDAELGELLARAGGGQGWGGRKPQ
jgi:thioredoxin 1